MSLAKWKPTSLDRPFGADPFFDRFLDLFGETAGTQSARAWHPALDLVEYKNSLIGSGGSPGRRSEIR